MPKHENPLYAIQSGAARMRPQSRGLIHTNERRRNEMLKFDPTKPVQTRDGRAARIICTDRKVDGYPILALVTQGNGSEDVLSYRTDGGFFGSKGSHPVDLINIPQKVWVNLYRAEHRGLYTVEGRYWPTQSAANYYAKKDRIACIEIELPEGEN